jgi:arrestin-related trafficking adapter 4/5/7
MGSSFSVRRAPGRLPVHPSASILGANYQTNTIYYHDWSFLQGERKHSHTLKAGRHVFPFQLRLEGWLPSTLSTHGGLGGVGYKLRATAVRPVFASNLHATASVRLVRSFATESLEYQQTLELENTWPDKMMYSLMVPHKAWAAGDTISVLAKFSPLAKGVRITSITTTIQEHVKTYTKLGRLHDTTRIIATAKHDIRNGQTETMQLNDPSRGVIISRHPSPPRSAPGSAPGSPALSEGVPLSLPEGTSSMDTIQANPQHVSGSVPAEGGESSVLGLSSGNDEQDPSTSSDNIDIGDEEVIATLPVVLSPFSTPSHTLEPIVVTHRIRWSVLMTNPDGHISELRCTLPVYILDQVLLEEARLATRATHRLIFGLEDPQQPSLEEFELPSYPAHILDRIANAYIPPSTIPTSNSLMTRPESESSGPPSAASAPDSMSPGSPPPTVGSRDVAASEPSGAVALDQVNSELHRLSHLLHRPGVNFTTPPDSTQTSRHASRASSRAASPERGTGSVRERQHHHRHHHRFSLNPFSKVASPFHGGHRHSASTADCASHNSGSTTRPFSELLSSEAASGSASPVLPRGRSEDGLHSMALMNGNFNEVPDYNVASRGFLGGGVTPLSSIRGLPSYEEAERSHSDGDLAARFAVARTMS